MLVICSDEKELKTVSKNYMEAHAKKPRSKPCCIDHTRIYAYTDSHTATRAAACSAGRELLQQLLDTASEVGSSQATGSASINYSTISIAFAYQQSVGCSTTHL